MAADWRGGEPGGGLFSPARAAAKRQRHIAADTRRQDAGSACHEPAKAAAAVRLGDWCGVCRYTTPSVASLAADSGNVLTVALRSGDNVTLEKWLTRKKLALPTVNDPSGQLARQWDIQVTPTLVVISQGEVKSVTTGWTSGWGMRLRLWLASPVGRRALAVFMPGKAYPPPGLPFGFDPVGPASAAPPGNRHLRVISRPPVQGSYPSHTTLCRSAAEAMA